MMTHATPQPWHVGRLQHPSYGSESSYRKVAEWVGVCAEIHDWGGSTGFLRHFLPGDRHYRVVDGTSQYPGTTVIDLTQHTQPAQSVVLRHVLDNTFNWQAVLDNALLAFQRRMAVVTFTPDADETHVVKLKSGWPIWRFNPNDLRKCMGGLLVREECVCDTHPERIYYLERAS